MNPIAWETVAAITTAVLGVIAVLGAVAKWLYRRYRSISLERSLGASSYDREVIARALRYYIPPFCSSIDPAQEAEPRGLIVAEEPIFAAVNKFLWKDSGNRHLVLLADSGMGKTAFVLNYYARNYSAIRLRRRRMAVVHLGSEGADAQIEAIANKRDMDLFLDALDEDVKAIKDHRSRIHALMRLSRDFKRVLITSRTQFFPSDEELPKETGILKTGPIGMESPKYQFVKLYLSPLTDEQANQYIGKRYPLWKLHKRRKAENLARKIPLLSVRPMLLTHLPDLMEAQPAPQSAFEIYKTLVERWYLRESSWCEPDELRTFSRRIAVEMLTRRVSRGTEWIRREELAELSAEWEIKLEEWQARGRSLLNRNAVGQYKFAHRSIMEFLFAQVLVDGVTSGSLEPAYMSILQHVHLLGEKRYRGPVVMLRPFDTPLGVTDQVSRFVVEAMTSRASERRSDQAFVKVPSLEMLGWRDKQLLKSKPASKSSRVQRRQALTFSAGSSELWLVNYGQDDSVWATVIDYTRRMEWRVGIEPVRSADSRSLHQFLAGLAQEQVGAFDEQLVSEEVRQRLLIRSTPVMRLVDEVRRAYLRGNLDGETTESGDQVGALRSNAGEDVQVTRYLTYDAHPRVKLTVGVRAIDTGAEPGTTAGKQARKEFA